MFDKSPLKIQASTRHFTSHLPQRAMFLRVTLLSRFDLSSRSLVVSVARSRTSITVMTKKNYSSKDRSRRRPKLPPDFGTNLFLKKPSKGSRLADEMDTVDDKVEEEGTGEAEEDDDVVVWEEDEVKAIRSLFQSRIPQKPGRSVQRRRPLPLPLPHMLKRPLGLPHPRKRQVKSRSAKLIASRNPSFLIGIAKEIKGLSPEESASVVLSKYSRFIRKGMLSSMIMELGRMGLPARALQVFCWAKGQVHLFPDDRLLASAVEVLARSRVLKLPVEMERFGYLASRVVIEAMVRGFTDGRSLQLALRVLKVAKNSNRMLGTSVYMKLITELGKIPDNEAIVSSLLEDLGDREDLSLSQQDCTALMKVCVRLGRFELIESLYTWYKNSGRDISVVIYTTLIHGRYMEKRYREALAVIWEMESLNCLLDLPAYRVAIKLFKALNDLPRAVRYFSKLKEAGFSPTYDIYRVMIELYADSGRLAKCKMACKEAEMAGFEVDRHSLALLLQLESGAS